MGHLDDDGKLHLAVGLNMRRRHLDGDRRRELVRRLHTEEGLSVRKLAAITGWSKSTVDRDLKTSPFEEIIREAHDAAESVRSETSEIGKSIADALDGFGAMFGWADSQWKRGTWPPPPDEHFEMTLAFFDFAVTFAAIHELAEADSPDQRKRVRERRGQQHDDIEGLRWKWNHWTPERRRDFAENKRHLLRPRLSDTYDKED
jgi:hypothetical protein